jgi:hypothetical protein
MYEDETYDYTEENDPSVDRDGTDQCCPCRSQVSDISDSLDPRVDSPHPAAPKAGQKAR